MARWLVLLSLLGCGKPSAIKHVFVVAFENQDASTVYGHAKAPYLNGLMATYAYATNYSDDYLKPNLVSEPHYVEMEAGTNVFSDATFFLDGDPSALNSTASQDHLVTLMKKVPGASWMAYQEDMPAPCPVESRFPYGAKHDPFVFFRDVSFTADAPDPNNAYCAAHHKDFATSFAADLAAKTVATYNFITPNLCNDMHGDSACSNGCDSVDGCIGAGDTWLAANLPPLIAFAEANSGVIFLVWDEAKVTSNPPFFVIGRHLRATGPRDGAYGHQSLVKSIAQIVGVPVLSAVSGATDFSDLFAPGYFP